MMRFTTTLSLLAIFTVSTTTAIAFDRMPGGVLQFLGWGYGAGHHVPIAPPPPRNQRACIPCPCPSGMCQPSHTPAATPFEVLPPGAGGAPSSMGNLDAYYFQPIPEMTPRTWNERQDAEGATPLPQVDSQALPSQQVVPPPPPPTANLLARPSQTRVVLRLPRP